MAPELNRRLDYSDYEATPDDGNRYDTLLHPDFDELTVDLSLLWS